MHSHTAIGENLVIFQYRTLSKMEKMGLAKQSFNVYFLLNNYKKNCYKKSIYLLLYKNRGK